MATAATLMSLAPVCMNKKEMIIIIANSVACHGTRLLMLCPMKGPNVTPPIPIKPKRPITSLEYTVNQHLNFYVE